MINYLSYVYMAIFLQPDFYSTYLLDAVVLYATMVNITLSENLDFRNGSLMFQIPQLKTFKGE